MFEHRKQRYASLMSVAARFLSYLLHMFSGTCIWDRSGFFGNGFEVTLLVDGISSSTVVVGKCGGEVGADGETGGNDGLGGGTKTGGQLCLGRPVRDFLFRPPADPDVCLLQRTQSVEAWWGTHSCNSLFDAHVLPSRSFFEHVVIYLLQL